MSDKIAFPGLIPIQPDEPINETTWWKWILNHPEVEDVFHIVFIKYLGPEFNKEIHFIPEEQVRLHKAVFSHFYWIKHHEPERLTVAKWAKEIEDEYETKK